MPILPKLTKTKFEQQLLVYVPINKFDQNMAGSFISRFGNETSRLVGGYTYVTSLS